MWKKAVKCGRWTKSTWQTFIIPDINLYIYPGPIKVMNQLVITGFLSMNSITPLNPTSFTIHFGCWQAKWLEILNTVFVFWKSCLFLAVDMENLPKNLPILNRFLYIGSTPSPSIPVATRMTWNMFRRPGIPSPKPLNLPLLLLGAGEMIQSISIYMYIYIYTVIYIY